MSCRVSIGNWTQTANPREPSPPGDAKPLTPIWFDETLAPALIKSLTSESVLPYQASFQAASQLILGFESPLGMELLATQYWLHSRNQISLEAKAMLDAVPNWPGKPWAVQRKDRLFEARNVDIGVRHLNASQLND